MPMKNLPKIYLSMLKLCTSIGLLSKYSMEGQHPNLIPYVKDMNL